MTRKAQWLLMGVILYLVQILEYVLLLVKLKVDHSIVATINTVFIKE